MTFEGKAIVADGGPDWGHLRATYAASGLLREECTVAAAAGIGSGRVVYLATPYSREVVDKHGVWCRDLHQSVVNVAGFWSWRLSYEGATAISPIVCADQIQVNGRCSGKGPGPLDDDWWSMWCLPLMRVAGCIVIPPIPGWDLSRGVWREACWALERGVPVCLISSPSKGVK
ncbi:DUF1937 family protein [uncultured Thioclava sp.]|uniref:DUF1937 family protein n=1 Tax=uncultured Thioclava sp. TaxID=473858 RepID=UPI0025F03F4C|nr:DUF1937 family protein [uncultured Thioclava sp.]